MNKYFSLTLTICGLIAGCFSTPLNAQRKFTHPGITYTQADLDRMKAMVNAKAEPFYSDFLALKASQYSTLDTPIPERGTQIKEGKFNGTIGIDGRRAHDLALLWHITGDTAYANKTVALLNASRHYTNTSSRGTGPLDNGKIYLLIDAAEMMRNYPGWKPEDQQTFKDMLVYPGYSSKENFYRKYASIDEEKNRITFYWNIYNGDAARYGNQGLFAMRSLLAMGIYLDNDTIYDRGYRYMMALAHRPDDLPYPAGPPISTFKNASRTQETYDISRNTDAVEDYGFDEQLRFYIYKNGQCQEASRDQAHVLAGLHNYVAIAEIAWNQGDSLYSALNNRILTGLEFAYRYNMSFMGKFFEDQPSVWEPSGYTENEDEVTYDNNLYLQRLSRSGRWKSLRLSSHGAGDGSGQGANREQAYHHYKIRAGVPENNMKWLARYRQYMLDTHTRESWGVPNNWYYEWCGWGGLTKTRTPWMAGDPGTFLDGKRISGIHQLPATIAAVDYDYYSSTENPEGHTYHNKGTKMSTLYRTDGTVEITREKGKHVVTDVTDGEWMNYTVSVPQTASYDVYITYSANGKPTFTVASDEGDHTSAQLPASRYKEQKIGTLHLTQGASVLRLFTDNAPKDLKIESIRITSTK